jgi:hypothetical protein
MSDSFAPVIIIEGFLGLGVVLWLYISHQRDMRRIRQEKDQKSEASAKTGGSPSGSVGSGSNGDPKVNPKKP